MNFAIAGIIIFAIAVLGALLFAGRNAAEQPRQVKVLRFALYFWLLVFLQLIVAALGYALLMR